MHNETSARGWSRRDLLRGVAAAGALGAVLPAGLSQAITARASAPIKLSMFSKILNWTDVAEAARMAREFGFDCIDLTVRPRGHVLPERVESDLPLAVQTIEKAGLTVSMISTEITSVQSPHADSLLKTASSLGIRHYRWGGLTYRKDQPIDAQLKSLRPQVSALAELGAKYNICGMYHTHSGLDMVGGPIWDLWMLFDGLDGRYIGMNYDIGHATVEGGFGGWQTSARLAGPQMRGIALKDFRWPQKDPKAEQGRSTKPAYQPAPDWCAIGDGIVDFVSFFEIAKGNGFSGPIQLHFEYPEFGGVELGEKTLKIPKERFVAMIGRDTQRIRSAMKQAGLV